MYVCVSACVLVKISEYYLKFQRKPYCVDKKPYFPGGGSVKSVRFSNLSEVRQMSGNAVFILTLSPRSENIYLSHVLCDKGQRCFCLLLLMLSYTLDFCCILIHQSFFNFMILHHMT